MMASAQQILILKKILPKDHTEYICLPIVLIVCKISENYYPYYF